MRITPQIVISVALIATACNNGSTLPVPPTPVPPMQPAPVALYGYVSDTAFRPVPGVRIDVLDGSQAGLFLTSDVAGRFSYLAPFDSPETLRLSKEGYLSRTVATQRPRGGSPYAVVRLESAAPPAADLEGSYTLTVVADARCTNLPDEVRTRTYTATITSTPNSSPDGTSFTLNVGGASLVYGHDHFRVGVAGNTVGLDVYALDDEFGLVEQVDPTRFLAVQGSAVASIGSASAPLTAQLDGVIRYCATPSATQWVYDCLPPWIAHESCPSQRHQLILERR